MKNCTDCMHAHWYKTSAGRLHPSGNGECHKAIPEIKLPEAFKVLQQAHIVGGRINRRETLSRDCIYFCRGDQVKTPSLLSEQVR